MTVVLVMVGGGVGAGLRYCSDRWIQSTHAMRFPLGTLTVNLVGCLIIGIVAGGVAHDGWSRDAATLLATGLCGGLTTFSAFSVEVVNGARENARMATAIYVLVSVVGGVALTQLGWALT